MFSYLSVEITPSVMPLTTFNVISVLYTYFHTWIYFWLWQLLSIMSTAATWLKFIVGLVKYPSMWECSIEQVCMPCWIFPTMIKLVCFRLWCVFWLPAVLRLCLDSFWSPCCFSFHMPSILAGSCSAWKRLIQGAKAGLQLCAHYLHVNSGHHEFIMKGTSDRTDIWTKNSAFHLLKEIGKCFGILQVARH